ncbi:hypothetical protein BJ944DRAFT_167951 [Cunninghamella echinulata]|nr:hypothetical protein BJ944DRAFT_167951 [Cunninghamella echinulata]
MSDTELTNHKRPTTDSVITIRCIKSFEYRTCKSLVLQHLNLETTTVGDLKKLIMENTLKLYTVAHGHKTMNLIINMEDDDRLIYNDDSAALAWAGVENETEISFFNRQQYEEYKKNPEMKW